jgi:hypothetical protein
MKLNALHPMKNCRKWMCLWNLYATKLGFFSLKYFFKWQPHSLVGGMASNWILVIQTVWETMFDACGFILPRKFNQDALTNFAQAILTCDA